MTGIATDVDWHSRIRPNPTAKAACRPIRRKRMSGHKVHHPRNYPNSRIGELLPHHRISADSPWPLWEAQVQTELPGKGEGDEHQAHERYHEDYGHLAARA